MLNDNFKTQDIQINSAFHARDIAMAALPDSPSTTLRMVPSSAGMAHGTLKSLRREVANCLLSHTQTNALATCHRDAQHAQNIGHLVLVSRYFHGSSKGYVHNKIIDRKPGAIYILDGALEWKGIREAGVLQTVYVPKTLLAFAPDTQPGFLMLDPSTALGGIVNSCLDDLFYNPASEAHAFAQSGIEQLVACTKLALGAPPLRGDVRVHARAALQQVIFDFIEHNLQEQSLSTGAILKQFGVSRANLYRMFEPHGGVRKYITDRRALHAVVDLSISAGTRGYVGKTGERWGFPSPAEFNRTIRRLYKSSPGDLFEPVKSDLSQIAA